MNANQLKIAYWSSIQMLSVKVCVIAQVHHDEDVLKEIKWLEGVLEGIELIAVGFDGKMLVKVTADTMEFLESRIRSVSQVNYIKGWGITEGSPNVLQGLPFWMHPY
jgi:hypothetical protein